MLGTSILACTGPPCETVMNRFKSKKTSRLWISVRLPEHDAIVNDHLGVPEGAHLP